MLLLRAYLLAGLITHKIVWEAMKGPRRLEAELQHRYSMRIRLVKLAKIVILAGILVQTITPNEWLNGLLIAENPLQLRVAGIVLYSLGLVMAIHSRLQLGKNWSDIETPTICSDHALISTGLYRYIRHPIYVGDLLLLLGLELALNSWLVIAVLVLIPVVLWKATREEKLMVHAVPGYAGYCEKTKRFVPFLV